MRAMTRKSLLAAIGVFVGSALLFSLYMFFRNEQGPASVTDAVGDSLNDAGQPASRDSRVLDNDGAPGNPDSQSVSANSQIASQPGDNEVDSTSRGSYQGNSVDAASGGSGQSNNEDTESDTPQLSQQVFDVITEVQKRQVDRQWEEALNEMNALYANFDELNSFEQATLLNFYTNALLALEMWNESISAFTLMLTVTDLRPDVHARALMALGQLHAQVGESESAILYYESFLDFAEGMEDMEDRIQRVRQLLGDD